jgi:kumamolisin
VEAASKNVTVVAASGDTGSSDGVDDGRAHVDFPSSSPNVLACGGSRLIFENDSVVDERVWGDSATVGTGGGISTVFALPPWQVSLTMPQAANGEARPGRGVPDVAAHSLPGAYRVHVAGQDAALGGTGAAAGLWAALIARLNQALGSPLGLVTPLLYELKRSEPSVFREITVGHNGAYRAQPGWNACTGLGSVDGTRLLDALRKRRSATA